jgi:hypothetical protein
MLYLRVPWTSVNLVDYFFVRRGRYAITHLYMPDGIYGPWGARGLTAYVVGFVATLPFFVLPDVYTGPAARALGGSTPRTGELDDYARRNPSETPVGSWAISFARRFHLPRWLRCSTWDCLRRVAGWHPVGAR